MSYRAIGVAAVVGGLWLLLTGCAATIPAYRYKTEMSVAADSLADSQYVLTEFGTSLRREGFEVSQRATSLSARRAWTFEVTADESRQESYSIEVTALAREPSVEVTIDAKTEQRVGQLMYERRWCPWDARSAAEMRDRVNNIAKLVALEYPRPSQP